MKGVYCKAANNAVSNIVLWCDLHYHSNPVQNFRRRIHHLVSHNHVAQRWVVQYRLCPSDEKPDVRYTLHSTVLSCWNSLVAAETDTSLTAIVPSSTSHHMSPHYNQQPQQQYQPFESDFCYQQQGCLSVPPIESMSCSGSEEFSDEVRHIDADDLLNIFLNVRCTDDERSPGRWLSVAG